MKRFCILASMTLALQAGSLTGSWTFSVDLESGDHGAPVFELKETNGRLLGKYRGPFGEQTATGSVDGATVKLRVAASATAGTVQLDYEGKIEGDRMSGTMTRNLSGKITKGTWTAARKK